MTLTLTLNACSSEKTITRSSEKTITRLTNNDAFDSGTSWSHDGTKIAFISERDGNSEIYVMNANGTNQTNISNNISNNDTWLDTPSWSPDGTKIVFESKHVDYLDYEIYVMNADGTNQTNISNNDAFDYSPSWSPDGTKIAFTFERDGNAEIYVYRLLSKRDK